ncbi:MAG: hypothetical protein IPM36_20125 [Lewinellaceae bacterium]|nr:hypothetical protein [Lewinellaceae bacterium]
MIVEPSDTLREGLECILTDRNNIGIVVEHCWEPAELYSAFVNTQPRILIASPAVFESRDKQIKSLREKYAFHSVGLVYSYFHPDRLEEFDALIHLNDNREKIKATVNKLLADPADQSGANTGGDTLSARETEVLRLLVRGNSTKKIAEALFISTHTVNAHRKNIIRKLDIQTVSGLTIYAVLNNIISLEEV